MLLNFETQFRPMILDCKRHTGAASMANCGCTTRRCQGWKNATNQEILKIRIKKWQGDTVVYSLHSFTSCNFVKTRQERQKKLLKKRIISWWMVSHARPRRVEAAVRSSRCNSTCRRIMCVCVYVCTLAVVVLWPHHHHHNDHSILKLYPRYIRANNARVLVGWTELGQQQQLNTHPADAYVQVRAGRPRA